MGKKNYLRPKRVKKLLETKMKELLPQTKRVKNSLNSKWVKKITWGQNG